MHAHGAWNKKFHKSEFSLDTGSQGHLNTKTKNNEKFSNFNKCKGSVGPTGQWDRRNTSTFAPPTDAVNLNFMCESEIVFTFLFLRGKTTCQFRFWIYAGLLLFRVQIVLARIHFLKCYGMHGLGLRHWWLFAWEKVYFSTFCWSYQPH